MYEKETNKWWKPLIKIPAVLIVDLTLFLVAALFDSRGSNNSELGHPFPVFTLLAIFLIAAITVITLIASLKRTISILLRKNIHAPDNKDHFEKPTWKYFIPLSIQILISIIAVIICGSLEINSFYASPDHIGFAIPAGTFFLAFILFAATIPTFIITMLCFKRKNKSAK